MRPLLLLFLALASPGGKPVSPVPWGRDGHQVVAWLAAARLSPAAAAEVRRLLNGPNLADVSAWADDIRSQRTQTASWHFVNIELIDSSYVPTRDCKAGACIIGAIERQTSILADRNRNDSVRAEALKFVIHFVGDIHQPLHGSNRGDRGGNDVRLVFQGRQSNLHSLWDSGLLGAFGTSTDSLVAELTRRIATRTDLATIGAATPEQWAMESHDIARDVVYKLLPESLDITPEYIAAARPVIEERLLRAGVRLAAVLNRTLAQ